MASMNSPLTKYRADRGLTLEHLAAQFNVNKSTIMRWEHGEVPVPANRLIEIESVTGIPRAELRPDIFGQAA